MGDQSRSPGTVAEQVAAGIHALGIRRIFGICGGHVQPVWDACARLGVEIVGVRHEMNAVLMAQATAELGGGLGCAMVTAGPGVTNAVTGIANCDSSRTPVLVVSGRPPEAQRGRGALQDIPQQAVVTPLCRALVMVDAAADVIPGLTRAAAAALGGDAPPGPAYIDFPTDLLREPAREMDLPAGLPRAGVKPPDAAHVAAAAEVLRQARRLLVITGRGVRADAGPLLRFLDLAAAVHLETSESRGAVPDEHPGQAPAMRARAMAEADAVLTLGRRLDFQLAYGSPAVFTSARAFVCAGRSADELGDRIGALPLQGDVPQVLEALIAAEALPAEPDRAWRDGLREASQERARKLAAELAAPPATSDGGLHPYALLKAVQDRVDDGTIAIADGGDILSFARVALRARRWLDPGPLGCLGVGVPFATAAALADPQARVIAVVGDGSFGLSAMEVETAVRTGARAVFVVSDNQGWNIERHDQEERYGGHTVAVDLGGSYDQLGRALGAHAERVSELAELAPALDRALAAAPAVVSVQVSREPISPDSRSGLAWVPDRQALASWDEAERRRAAASD